MVLTDPWDPWSPRHPWCPWAHVYHSPQIWCSRIHGIHGIYGVHGVHGAHLYRGPHGPHGPRQAHTWSDRRTVGRVDGRTDARAGRQVDDGGRVDWRAGGRTDGRVNARAAVAVDVNFASAPRNFAQPYSADLGLVSMLGDNFLIHFLNYLDLMP